MSERRISPRCEISLPAIFRGPKIEDDIHFAMTRNVSATGLCFSAKAQPAIGEQLALELELPKDLKIVLAISVVWSQEAPVLAVREYLIGAKIANSVTPVFAQYVKFYKETFAQVSS